MTFSEGITLGMAQEGSDQISVQEVIRILLWSLDHPGSLPLEDRT